MSSALLIGSCGLFGAAKPAPEYPAQTKPKVTTADTARIGVIDTTIRRNPDSLHIATTKKGKSWLKKERYSISYVLPFTTDEAELEKLMMEDNITGYQPLASIEFYEGALMALDTLDSLGIHLDVHVYNHFKDSSLTAALFSKPELRKSDAIIGPVFNEGLKAAAGVAHKQEVFMLSPLSPNHNFTDSNRYFMMANPAAASQLSYLLEYVSKAYPSANIISIFRSDRPGEVRLANEFREAFNEVNTSNLMHLKEAYTFAGATEALATQNNFVFIASFDELYTNGLVRDLSKVSRETPLMMLGLPHILSFESISIDYFENLHFTYPTAYFVDKQSEKVDLFIENFSDTYDTRPSDFAFRGYDYTLYIGMMLQQYGPDLAASAGKPNAAEQYMLYPLRFEAKTDAAGNVQFYENSNITILQYDQYQFVPVNK